MSEPTDSVSKPPVKSSAALRTVLLLGVLVLIAAGGLWDWYGAKEPRDKAYDRVLAIQGTANGMADASKAATTQADVQKAVGTEPSESVTEDGVIYERYSWRRGIPWMTYDLWVLYRGDDSKEMLVAQIGEEGKPDPIYAANSRGGKAPLPDPDTVRPIVEGESPYPPPRTEASATPAGDSTEGPTAEGDAAAAPEKTEGSESPAPESGDAPAESEDPAPEGASTADPEEDSAPSTPAEEPKEGDASPETPASDKPEGDAP